MKHNPITFSACMLAAMGLLSCSAPPAGKTHSAQTEITTHKEKPAPRDNWVLAQAPEEALPDADDLVVWKENRYPSFTKGSVVNANEWLHDGQPAGSHGALKKTEDGNLVFEDGTPVRFWGTTLGYGASFPETDREIEAMADAIASKGYNLVRFHHNDSPWSRVSFLKGGSAFEFDPESIAVLDKVMKAFIDRGIYIYLDLIDSRGWTAEVGMEDWEALRKKGQGWKGAFPMPVMVDAWKRAADNLLQHVNPHTGKSLAEDPAVICVEIINENGPFWDWGFKTTPAIQAWFDAAWNRWLVERYGNREALAEAWTDAEGTCGLFDDEDPARGTVYRPQLQKIDTWKRSYRSKSRGAARYNDFIAFYRDIATDFYQEASAHLRDRGFKGQIIGSHELRGPQNQLAEIEGTHSISAHLYSSQRLAFSARPGNAGVSIDGVDVSTKNWFSNMARISVDNVPGWNNEWTVNSLSYRADAHLAAASMMAFQDIDGSVHFTWSQRWGGEKMPDKDVTIDWIGWRKKFHNSFSSLHDAPSMATHRIAAALMRRKDIPPAKYTVHIAHSAEDAAEQNLHAVGIEGGGGTIGNAAQFLPMLHHLETTFYDTAYQGDADVVFSSGRSASGDYRQAKHAVILGDNPWTDRYHKQRDLAAPARLIHPGLVTQDIETPTTFTLAFGYESPLTVKFATLEAAIEVSSLPKGATPIGLSEDEKYTLGWCDDRFLVFPAAGQFDRLNQDPRWLYRFYLTAAERWGMDLGNNSMHNTTYYSDNGALQIDWGSGTQLINTPRTQAVAGYPGLREENRTDNLSVQLDRPYGSISLSSADDQPIAQSRRMLLVAAGRIQNTGTTFDRNESGKVIFTKTGKAPMLIEGLHGKITLHDLAQTDLKVYALDVKGRRLGEVTTEWMENDLHFDLNPQWQTLWFEIAGPEIEGPEAGAKNWPAEKVAAPAATDLPKLTVDAYVSLLTQEESIVKEEVVSDESNRIDLTDAGTFKSFQAYGNLKAKKAKLEDRDAIELDLGKHTDEWHAGLWFNAQPLPGLKPEDCEGFTFFFKGDGTLPRDFNISVKWKDDEGKEQKAKSRNLNELFEDSEWKEIILTPKDFPEQDVDLSRLHRIDFSVVSKLMETKHTAYLGSFQLATVPGANNALLIEDLEERMPEPVKLPAPALELSIKDTPITADGEPGEEAWKHAVGLQIDENEVPAWHKIGSVLASGKIKENEKATAWVTATKQGLGLYVAVDKNGAPVVNNKKEWYDGDCIEIFVDAKAEGVKPSKQLFFAYKRPGLNRATSSVNASVGRMQTPEGYALEILIPWHELGVKGSADTVFSMDFQIDFGDHTGRYLQFSYATGTNEAWFTSLRYLKVKLTE
ncbi:cellulase family glycosylhydrolase [Kiritimatiellaeota bacterium B1221]|nr:cellulase family glycosylhydrolase [Kiritimatiellaeota bacterium B1221]